MVYSVRHLKYISQFACIGKDCPHNCCQGWTVQLEGSDLARMEKERQRIGSLYDNIDVNTKRLKKGSDGNCLMLDGEGLCSLQKQTNHATLPSTCQVYPRVMKQYRETIRLSGAMSCPEIARLLIEKEDSCEEPQKPITRRIARHLLTEHHDLTSKDELHLYAQDLLFLDLKEKPLSDSLLQWIHTIKRIEEKQILTKDMFSMEVAGETVAAKEPNSQDVQLVAEIVCIDLLSFLYVEKEGIFRQLWNVIYAYMPRKDNALDVSKILYDVPNRLSLYQRDPHQLEGILRRVLHAQIHASPLCGDRVIVHAHVLYIKWILTAVALAYHPKSNDNIEESLMEIIYSFARMFDHSVDLDGRFHNVLLRAGFSTVDSLLSIHAVFMSVWGVEGRQRG